jgi:hypothetical protein
MMGDLRWRRSNPQAAKTSCTGGNLRVESGAISTDTLPILFNIMLFDFAEGELNFQVGQTMDCPNGDLGRCSCKQSRR